VFFLFVQGSPVQPRNFSWPFLARKSEHRFFPNFHTNTPMAGGLFRGPTKCRRRVFGDNPPAPMTCGGHPCFHISVTLFLGTTLSYSKQFTPIATPRRRQVSIRFFFSGQQVVFFFTKCHPFPWHPRMEFEHLQNPGLNKRIKGVWSCFFFVVTWFPSL